MSTSNSTDPVQGTADGAASASETPSAPTPTSSTPPAQAPAAPTGLEALKAKAEAVSSGSLPDPNADPNKPVAPAPVVPPAFAPNWKYKAFGKEKEIDEFWRPLVKDPDSEKKVKDVFTRADAFDEMKAKHEGTTKEFQGLLGEYQALDKDVKRVMTFRNNRDFDNFFQSLRISDKEIFEWVQKKLGVIENPELQRQHEQQALERQRNYDLSQQRDELQTQYQAQAAQARAMQLDMILSRPDVSKIASLFDERQGNIGSFRQLVIEEAAKHYYSTGGENGGKDLSAEEATQMVLQKWGKFFEASQAPGQTPNPLTPQAPGIAPQAAIAPKPVIPATQGKGTSPIKKAPKSLDDLRKLAAESQANS